MILTLLMLYYGLLPFQISSRDHTGMIVILKSDNSGIRCDASVHNFL